jgi:hypothetical protein
MLYIASTTRTPEGTSNTKVRSDTLALVVTSAKVNVLVAPERSLN